MFYSLVIIFFIISHEQAGIIHLIAGIKKDILFKFATLILIATEVVRQNYTLMYYLHYQTSWVMVI